MEDKIYFLPGDLVTLNKFLLDAPEIMLVVGKSSDSDQLLKGIKCLFFDKMGVPHEYIFSTKDLILYNPNYVK